MHHRTGHRPGRHPLYYGHHRSAISGSNDRKQSSEKMWKAGKLTHGFFMVLCFIMLYIFLNATINIPITCPFDESRPLRWYLHYNKLDVAKLPWHGQFLLTFSEESVKLKTAKILIMKNSPGIDLQFENMKGEGSPWFSLSLNGIMSGWTRSHRTWDAMPWRVPAELLPSLAREQLRHDLTCVPDHLQYVISRRKFRNQTSDNMDRWKAEQGRGREKRKIRRKKSRRGRVRRKKMQMREKVGKSRNTVFFQWFVAPEGQKVGSLKRRVRSQLARGEMKNCTPLWREAHFQVKMYKTHHVRTTFGSWDVEKVHAVVAQSTFRSQNVQNTPCTDHFCTFRCRNKCTPLWREAHFEVKIVKTPGVRTTFGGSDVASLQ